MQVNRSPNYIVNQAQISARQARPPSSRTLQELRIRRHASAMPIVYLRFDLWRHEEVRTLTRGGGTPSLRGNRILVVAAAVVLCAIAAGWD